MTDTKLTDLPLAPTEWEPTPHLRWQRTGSAVRGFLALQQKWVEVRVYVVADYPHPNASHGIPRAIREPTGKEQWRAVPTEEQ